MAYTNAALNLSDPGAELPSIILSDGRVVTMQTSQTLPHALNRRLDRMRQRAQALEKEISRLVDEEVPTDLTADAVDNSKSIDHAQAQLDALVTQVVQIICPDLSAVDVAALTSGDLTLINTYFLVNATHFVERVMGIATPTQEAADTSK